MGGTWAVGYFRHVFRGLIFPRPKQKWQENGFTEKKCPDQSLRPPPEVTGLWFFGTPCQKIKNKTVLAVDRI